MICADLHVHTRFSFDASISPNFLIESLNAHPVIKAVAITDHNTVEGYFYVQRLAAVYRDLVIIPGVEVTTVRGDLIVLGVKQNPAYWSSIESVVDFAQKRNGVVIVPHPYRGGGIGDAAKKIPSGIGAVEVLNPDASPEENQLAATLSKTANLPGVSGSDAHHIRQMWRGYTEIDADPDVVSILQAIRSGHVKPVLAKG